ncbi:uncharacterized protein METZ01_LOCUS46134 [marine metagenome]|uniref:Uncharacterized protein n=1 Tax=marine metagenome TaxID=408172 RepID=A0A381RN24_9ZZZZ
MFHIKVLVFLLFGLLKFAFYLLLFLLDRNLGDWIHQINDKTYIHYIFQYLV